MVLVAMGNLLLFDTISSNQYAWHVWPPKLGTYVRQTVSVACFMAMLRDCVTECAYVLYVTACSNCCIYSLLPLSFFIEFSQIECIIEVKAFKLKSIHKLWLFRLTIVCLKEFQAFTLQLIWAVFCLQNSKWL